MKKIFRSYLFWLIIISAFFATPLVFVGFTQNHDNIAHLARGAQYILAIKDGQFPPRWAPTSNYGYGSPVFIFFYPLTGYILALFYFLGFSLEKSYLIFSFLTFLLGPVAFYVWMRQLVDKKTAFFASLVYLFLPYRFLTLYVRGGIGEFLSFSLVPWVFYYIERFKKEIAGKNVVLAGIIVTLIILSHNAVALLFLPIFLVYALLSGKKVFIASFLSIIIGLLLSSYFWIPSLVEGKYTQFNFYFAGMFKQHFPAFSSLIYSPWGFGPDINKPGGLSAQIGILAFIIVLIALFFLFAKKFKNETKYIVLWLLVFFFGIFISTQISKPLWNASAFLRRFQFPWRFIMLPSFAAAALAPYVFSKIENKKIIAVTLLIFGIFTVQYMRLPNTPRFSDKYYFSYPGSTYYYGEATTIWTAGDPYVYPKKPIEIIGGSARINNLQKSSTKHSFVIVATSPVTVLDNTIYFPGWEAIVNGKEVPIQFQDPEHKGFITFVVAKGNNNVEVKFSETKIRLFSDTISLVSIVGICLWMALNFIKKPAVVGI